jgi:hypothetical protein
MRTQAMNFYAEQIIENLIRGKNGLLFVHVNIDDQVAKTTVGTDGSGSAVRLSAAAISRTLSASITPKASDEVTVSTEPVTNDGETYKPYLQFLNLDNPEQRLQDSTFDCLFCHNVSSVEMAPGGQRPAEGTYVPETLMKWRGNYYYVPLAYRQAYFDLCMAVIGRVQGASRTGGTSKTGGARKGPTVLPPRPDNLFEKLNQIQSDLRTR